ncbi:radical SAM protein, partial [Alphaproteobacteria bacterium]|nr:radical SAM protein [Alphaproteobacteria bacterium]
MRVDLIDTTSDYIPLALFYLKSYAETDPLLQKKTSINIINPKNISNVEDSVDEILIHNPNIIGFSCYIWNMKNTVDICNRVKEINPQVKIIVGGPDVSSVPRKTLEKYSSIDVIVCGEGEETFRELIHYWEDIEDLTINTNMNSIDGLAFRDKGEIIITNKRPFIDQLDIIPSPYLNGCVDLNKEKRTILFETYRGCPFKCSFCYYPKDYGKLLHKFSMNRVRDNIKEILSSNAKEIFLMDPTFNIPKKRAKEILKLIKKYRNNNDISVTVELRVDLLDKEIMDLLKEANITVIEVGLQSSNIDVMSAVDRKQSTKLISENVKYMQSLGIETIIQLIYGLPEETTSTYLDSIDYGVSLDVSKVEPYQLQLLPGTPMYKSADLLGLNFVDQGERHIISTRTMSEGEVEEAGATADLVQVFYNDRTARSSLKWYSSYSGKTFSRIIEEYKEWRYDLYTKKYIDWV